MIIEYNSHIKFYKNPFGAVNCGEKVTLRIGICEGGLPEIVRVVCKFKGEIQYNNMSYIYNVGNFCIYEAEIKMPEDAGLFWYYFEVSGENGNAYYTNNEKNLGGLGRMCENEPENAYQITVYSPDYKTPEWFKNSVCYQIFPDRFANGNENGEFSGNREDIIKRNWGEVPFYKAEQFGSEYKANDFFGGNLKGIEKKLEYLKELGVGSIYLNPIFKAYSNHKYDTGNYMEIDENFGTEEDFKKLCKTAKELGIGIILDGVFNHTGSDSIYFNKDGKYDSLGAYQSQESPYYSWYNFSKWPQEYDSWWGMKTLPGVNEKSEEYQNYILKNDDSVVKHWLKQGASGWRLDVVDELPGFFVKELRKAVKSVNEDAVIIGEVWEDASNKMSYGEQREYFLGKELDSVMNYPLRCAFIDFAKGYIDAEEFNQRIMSIKENYPSPAYYSLLNILSSHDVERILTSVSNAPYSDDRNFMAEYKLNDKDREDALKKVRQIVMMQMLMPGVPCIYYGDEIGMEGYRDPFSRGCYEWNGGNCDLKEWYKRAISLRKESKAFTKGEMEAIYSCGGQYSFIRYYGKEKYIVCVNFSEKTEWIRLDLARYSVKELSEALMNENIKREDGVFYTEMKPGAIKVFKSI